MISFWTRFLLAALAMSTRVHAFGGANVGNGGGVWTCRNSDPNASIRWVELVDLYEAKNDPVLQLEIPYRPDPYLTQVQDILNRLHPIHPEAAQSLSQEVQDVLSRMKPTQTSLSVTDDALTTIEPERQECNGGTIAYEQLANYRDDGVILRRSSIWLAPQLSETDRAALVLHEAVYSLLRKNQRESNSLNTRKLVGYLFSTAAPISYLALLERAITSRPLIPYDPTAATTIPETRWIYYADQFDRASAVRQTCAGISDQARLKLQQLELGRLYVATRAEFTFEMIGGRGVVLGECLINTRSADAQHGFLFRSIPGHGQECATQAAGDADSDGLLVQSIDNVAYPDQGCILRQLYIRRLSL